MVNRNLQPRKGFSVSRDLQQFFFEALVRKELRADSSNLNKKAEAISKATRESLEPYKAYLKNALDAENNRQNYSCYCRKISEQDRYRIEWKYPRYSLSKKESITFEISKKDLKPEKNRLFFETSGKTISFPESEARFDAQGKLIEIKQNDWSQEISSLKSDDIVELNSKPIPFQKFSFSLKNGDTFTQKGSTYTIHKILKETPTNIFFEIEIPKAFPSSKDPISCKGESLYLAQEKIPCFEHLLLNGNELLFEKESEGEYSFPEVEKIAGELKDENGNIFVAKPYSSGKAGKNTILIELIDDNSTSNFDDLERTPSDVFLESENLQAIHQELGPQTKVEFKVKKIYREKHQLRIERNDEYEIDEELPIKMSVDLSNLNRQRRAIRTLQFMPMNEHRKLIKLFEDKDKVKFNTSNSNFQIEWKILTNENYSGVENQREFVKRALSIDDFMLLEGPPGSGKTTAILELILQLIAQDKKILLTASTHVAIDNILERIKDYPQVVPLRLGRDESIGESVRDFSIENQIKNLDSFFERGTAERFLIDSSNLVCGTTMGIQNHPDLRNAKKQDDTLLVPSFDVMIIDEASKTTFQEFLVPALLAKKWIIIGDIQQLSPYSETAYLQSHLKASIDPNFQETSNLINHLEKFFDDKRSPGKVFKEINLKHLAIEIPKGIRISDLQNFDVNDFPHFQNTAKLYVRGNSFHDFETDEKVSFVEAYGKNLIFIESGSLESVKNQIPEFFLLISSTKWKSDSYKRRFNLLHQDEKDKEKDVFESLMQDDGRDGISFFNKSWSEEVSWRLVRKFERRNLHSNRPYASEIELEKLLKNISGNDRKLVDSVEHFFFPSVLELLQKGNSEAQRFSTTLTSGFGDRRLENHFIRLDYQHRMHPEISEFSRSHFYGESRGIAELKDGPEMESKRVWDYRKFNGHHAVWFDVKRRDEKSKSQTKNHAEADAICKELEDFISWNEPHEKKYSVAILTYYRGQEALLREMLRKRSGQSGNYSHFKWKGTEILLYTIDKFQGREADVVFLSLCRDRGLGFMDSINRLNVALTRAKYLRVIFGNRNFFKGIHHKSDELRALAEESFYWKEA